MSNTVSDFEARLTRNRAGSRGTSLLPKSFLWQRRSSVIPASRWTLRPWPRPLGTSFAHAGPELGWTARRAGGHGHLVWEVPADRWLSGGRTFQAETNLRTAVKLTETSQVKVDGGGGKVSK